MAYTQGVLLQFFLMYCGDCRYQGILKNRYDSRQPIFDNNYADLVTLASKIDKGRE